MIKRIIAIIFCVVVLLSFSLTSFAGSFDIYEYRNVNSITESFLLSFLSFSCVDIKFYDFDNDYVGEEFDMAARYNLVARFANYLEVEDPALLRQIYSFAEYSGVTSPFNSSSFVWEGRLKYCRDIVSDLLSHFFVFIMPYWVTNGEEYGYYGLVPLQFSINDVDYTGSWSYVEFVYDDVRVHPAVWYMSFVVPVQNYLDGYTVADNFAGANLPYFWDYSRYGTGIKYPGTSSVVRVNYLDYIENYIDYYNNSSDDGSGDNSSGDNSSGSSGDNSSDSSGDNSSDSFVDPELLSFIKMFYRSFFLGLISTYNVDFYPGYSNSTPVADPTIITKMLPIIDCLYNYVMGYRSSSYIDSFYPNIKEDFLVICESEMEYGYFSNYSVYSIYPFSEDVSYRRFVLGFFELFKY